MCRYILTIISFIFDLLNARRSTPCRSPSLVTLRSVGQPAPEGVLSKTVCPVLGMWPCSRCSDAGQPGASRRRDGKLSQSQNSDGRNEALTVSNHSRCKQELTRSNTIDSYEPGYKTLGPCDKKVC